MGEEYNALMMNAKWTLVNLLAHAQVVGCKWAFKGKKHLDGSLQSQGCC